ncbi:MAG: hypothetical protein ABSF21_00880 [Dehalococcoidia bacterium]
MDETKGKPEDSLQKPGQTSQGTEGTTPTTKTYTEDEVNKRISDALAAKGRDAKALADKEASLNARDEAIKAHEAEINDIKRRRDEAELEDARRDPTKLTAYQERKAREKNQLDLQAERDALKKDRAALERDKTEHAEALKAAQETQLEIELWEIGAEFNVNPVTLKDTMKDLNLTTAEQAKALAKRISETLKRPAESEPLKVDSGVTSGHKESTAGKSAPQIYADTFRKEK